MHIQTQTMPMQTRSMTRRAGEPHDLEAFHSYAGYAEPDFDAHLPPKKRPRFLDWDEDSDDEPSFTPSDDEEDSQATIVDDEEDSFEAATGSSDAYDPNHFCPSWVKCCEENLAAKPPAPKSYLQRCEEHLATKLPYPTYKPGDLPATRLAGVMTHSLKTNAKLPPPKSWVECNSASSGLPSIRSGAKATNSVLGPRQYAVASASCSPPPPTEPATGDWHIPVGLNIATLPPLPRWPEMLATFRTRFTRSQWRDYIGEICHNISYGDKDCSKLTTEEYAAARDFMHGNL